MKLVCYQLGQKDYHLVLPVLSFSAYILLSRGFKPGITTLIADRMPIRCIQLFFDCNLLTIRQSDAILETYYLKNVGSPRGLPTAEHVADDEWIRVPRHDSVRLETDRDLKWSRVSPIHRQERDGSHSFIIRKNAKRD